MNPNRPAINWTTDKIFILRTYYPTMFNDALAKWIGCSYRTLERKAAELGLKKVENFNEVRAYDISRLLSVAVKKAYADGRLVAPPKGVRPMPEHEFKPGHKFSEEIEEARKEKIRKTYRRNKLLTIYGLSK